MPKKTKTALIVIGILIVISIIGFTYAYIGRKPVQGNLDNTIVLDVVNYGRITVTYENGNNHIEANFITLPESEAGTNSYYMLKFNINSTANIAQDVQIRWKDLINNFCMYKDNNDECTNNSSDTDVRDELTYELYSCTSSQYGNVTTPDDTDISSCNRISGANTPVPQTGKKDTLHTSENVNLTANSTTYYIVRVTLKNKNAAQNYNEGKSFSGTVNVTLPVPPPTLADVILESYSPVSDAIASTYVSDATGINFGSILSPSNGQGLYINDKNDQDGLIKYFRGGTYCAYTGYADESNIGTQCIAAGGSWNDYTCSYNLSKSACEGAGFTWYELNNNVLFGEFSSDYYVCGQNVYGSYTSCYQAWGNLCEAAAIQGNPISWKILRINENGTIRMIYNGVSPFAKEGGTILPYLASYNYDTGDGPSNAANEETLARQYAIYTGTNIKSRIDSWYNSELIDLVSYLSDEEFCSDTTWGYQDPAWEYLFSSYNRFYFNNAEASFACPDTETYSVVNNKLDFPIATITIDDATYAGLGKVSFIQNGYSYWTMSPARWNSNGYVSMTHIMGDGRVSYNGGPSIRMGVRPVINLKANVIVASGSGTLDDPWVIAN